MSAKTEKLTKEFLIEEYVNKRKTVKQIAKNVGNTHVTILNHMNKYKIPRRKRYYL